MKKIIYLLILLSDFSVSAQTFNGTGGNIPDYNNVYYRPVYLPCVVSGLPSSIDSVSFGLEKICLDITHTYDQDLQIELMSPDSFIVMLSNRNGESLNNYTSTCFRGNGANGRILNGMPPFTGEFDPDSDMFQFNNGRNPNGTWYLIVTDVSSVDTGWVNSFYIVFGNNPTPHVVPPCSTTDATSCRCPDGSQDCDLLPDMIASAASLQNGSYESNDTLYVDNATPNIGWGPLEVHGIDSCFCDTTWVPCTTTLCPNGQPPKQLVNQTIYHKHNGVISTWNHPAGTMSYHPTHGHIHIDGWASYTLRRAVAGLLPPDWPILGQGSKVSYCLINIGTCSINPNGNGYCLDSAGTRMGRQNIPNFGMGSVTGCYLDQGIFVGNYDVYSQYLPGQWIILDSLCNGNYYLVSITDPNNFILETNDNNNWAAIPVTLSQQLNLPFPTVNFSYSSMANTITFTDGSSDVDSVRWDFGDGVTDTAFSPQHTYSNTGIYSVVLTGYNHCGITQSLDTIDLTLNGVFEKNSVDVSSLSVYPNPAATQLYVDFNMAKRSLVSLRLFDLLGKQVFTFADEFLEAGSHHYALNTLQSGIAKGVYSLRLTSSGANHVKRIVLMRAN